MLEKLTSSIIKSADLLAHTFKSKFKGYVYDYCDLDTPLSKTTLVTCERALISYIEIKGMLKLVGDEELSQLLRQMEILFSRLLERADHALQWVFSRSPISTAATIENLLLNLKLVSDKLAFNAQLMDTMIESKSSSLISSIIDESCILSFKTFPNALSNTEKKSQFSDGVNSEIFKSLKRENLPLTFGRCAQSPWVSVSKLKYIHEATLQTICDTLTGAGINLKIEILDVHTAINQIRRLQDPDGTAPSWRPVLPGDPIPLRQTEIISMQRDRDFYPSIPSQIFKRSAELLPDVIKYGEMFYATVFMDLPPQDPQYFNQLFRRIPQSINWRYSLTIIGGDKEFYNKISLRSTLSKLFAVTNKTYNTDIAMACTELADIRNSGELLVGIRIHLSVSATSQKIVKEHAQICSRVLQSWGNCDTSTEIGDGFDTLVSTLPGLDNLNTGNTLITPLRESTFFCPFNRPVSPWQHGAHIYKTHDGRIYPLEQGSSFQSSWINLIYGRPGSGKSMLLNSQNLNNCFKSGLSQLPIVRILDIGPSSYGLVDFLQAALPYERRGEVVYHVLKNNKSFAINPFDTPLGLRVPNTAKKSFLKSFLSLLFTEDGQQVIKAGLGELISALIDETYKTFSDEHDAKCYDSGVEPSIDIIIKEHPEWFTSKVDHQSQYKRYKLTWWNVVDILADKQLWNEASLAQRYAVPLLIDLTAILHQSQLLKDLFSRYESDEFIYNHLIKMIRSVINEYTLLSYPTRFNLGQARVVSIDLADVTGGANHKQAAIMYMLARETLVGSLYFDENDIRDLKEPFHNYHITKISTSLSELKYISYDEFHRTGNLPSVNHQILEDAREGRKFNVQLTVSSQRLQDFPAAIVSLATAIFICDGANGEDLEYASQVLSLNKAEKTALQYDLNSISAFMLRCVLKEGVFSQVLLTTLSAFELWALSSTAEDVALRKKLIASLPYMVAIKCLIDLYPDGSAKKSIESQVIDTNQSTEEVIAKMASSIISAKTKENINEL